MMRRLLPLAGLALAVLAASSGTAPAQELKLHRLEAALHEMREAAAELRDAKHDFGGHRKEALEALEGAIRQVDEGLRAVGITPHRFDTERDRKFYEQFKYENFPHLRHALVEIREARKELEEVKGDLKGHKERALRDLERAHRQLEQAIKFAK
jgi:hypothetical protein